MKCNTIPPPSVSMIELTWNIPNEVTFLIRLTPLLTVWENVLCTMLRQQDYLYYNDISGDRVGTRNNDFQKVIKFIKEDKRCRGSRLHWGKAGWPDGACDDTGSDYPKTWCHFGCAVRELDPTGKFQQESVTFKWNERKLRQCCTSQGFNDSLPGCRHGCKSESPDREMIASRTCRYPPPHPSKRFPNLW